VVRVAEFDRRVIEIFRELVELDQFEFSLIKDDSDHLRLTFDGRHQLEARHWTERSTNAAFGPPK
jgi:hypothetical protein